MSTKWIIVDGAKYPVVEALGYNHDMGARAWIVRTEGGEKTAVGPSTRARFWTPHDRTRPLFAYYGRKIGTHTKLNKGQGGMSESDEIRERQHAELAAILLALKAATDMMAKDPRTRDDDERWSVFSQCVAALVPWYKMKDRTNPTSPTVPVEGKEL